MFGGREQPQNAYQRAGIFLCRVLKDLALPRKPPLSPDGVSALTFFPQARVMQCPARPSGRCPRTFPSSPPRARPRRRLLLLLAERAPHCRRDALLRLPVFLPRIFVQPREPLCQRLDAVALTHVVGFAKLIPGERRGDARPPPRPRRKCGDGARGLRVAQIVREHLAFPSLLGHFGGEELRFGAHQEFSDVAGELLDLGPAELGRDRDDDVQPLAARRLEKAAQLERLDDGSRHLRGDAGGGPRRAHPQVCSSTAPFCTSVMSALWESM